ncbi:MAG: TGS domain-containing protein, partial [archaeon]
IPGTLEYKHAQIQIFDVPGIVGGASEGTGRGKEVLSAIRSADMIILLVDIHQLNHYRFLMKELYNSDFRLNKKKPDVIIKKISRGGISIGSTVPLKVDKKTLAAILGEFRIMNADVLIRSPIDADEMIDCIEGNKNYLPGLLVINKIDTASHDQIKDTKNRFPRAEYISADSEINLEGLRERIYQKLKFMSIFLKEPGKEPDMEKPLIMREGNAIKDLCDKLHKDFVRRYKFCRIWGKSARYPGQKIVSLNHVLMDGDVAELHLR